MRKHLSGFTLLEVLISTFILALILLAFDAAQLVTLRQAKSAYFYSVAADQLEAMDARLTLTHHQLSPSLLQQWNQQNKYLLPQGQGEWHAGELVIHWGKNDGNCIVKAERLSGCLRLIL